MTLAPLGEAATIDAAVNTTLACIDAPDYRQDLKAYSRRADAALTALHTQLLQPLKDAQDAVGTCARLIVSPDGELNKVPFAALRRPDGLYLVEKQIISYVASGRDLLRHETDVAATLDLLLVANPAFDDQEALHTTPLTGEVLRTTDFGERFDPLPGTAEEARVIPPLVTGAQKRILEGREATASAVRTTTSPRILHLATHGFFLQDEEMALPEALPHHHWQAVHAERGPGGVIKLPALMGRNRSAGVGRHPMVRSGLALAGANHARTITTGENGLLTALEVTGMNLYGTDLVVLSACQTALGDVHVGEGVYGLRRAFVLAGAKNLVMSLWRVNDQVTLSQMAHFYRAYGQGVAPAQAMCEAQVQTIAALRARTTETYGEALAPVKLWAPFIVQQTGG